MIWTLTLVLTLVIALALGAGRAESRKTGEKAKTSAIAVGVAGDVPRSGAGKVRITLFLTDNSIAAALEENRAALSGRLPGAAAAKRAALRSPNEKTAQEDRIASMMDDQRNSALPDLRRAARTGTAQSERVAAAVTKLGGRVVDATPFPNTLTVVVPARVVNELEEREDVYAVTKAEKPVLASSPVDGSETWHSNGFTGGGSSADGNGGPDAVIFDTGMRTAHTSFRSRQLGDSPTGPGTGGTRVISPAGRSDFSGSEHGNQIGAIVGATDLTFDSISAPFPPTWQLRKGQAYGLDKLYDTRSAQNAYRWWLGVTFNGEAGVTDLPEVVNFSAGIYEDNVDSNTAYTPVDASVSQYGIAYTVSAGNCGIATPSYTNCTDGPHRVSTPGNNYNVITAGGLDMQTDPYNSAVWTVWANSSPGPTFGGRKKPDLIAVPFGVTSCPNDQNNTTFENCGDGTSYAAPQVASGVTLLASTGVYAPTAQKAILVNTATPIQGQTYWSPLTGWGALNLDAAFTNRAHYANGSVTAAGSNGVRFYRQNGVVSGDRTTLVWNRRTGNYTGNNAPAYNTLTNLDLIQVDSSSGTVTATGGSDAADTVDTNQTVSAANPMPGNGSDGGDNVEQVRSTAAGTEVYKVKAMSTVDGATSEPFSIAGNHPIAALTTPIPSVDLQTSTALAQPSADVTVTAQVTNPSPELALSGGSVTLTLPAGVSLVSGSATQSIGTLAASGSTSVNWTVEGTTEGLKSLSATASGTTYNEPFSGTDSADVTIDGTAPVVSVNGPGTYSSEASAAFSWSGSDAVAVATYDVEISRNGGAFELLLGDTTSTSTNVAGSEGEALTLRVTAVDTAGNVSAAASASTTIDAQTPAIALGATSFPKLGTAAVTVGVSNVGSPVSVRYRFAPGSGALVPLIGSAVSYSNASSAPTTANLRVEATDALGRTTVATRSVSVPSPFLATGLKVRSAKVKNGRLVVAGTLAKGASGRVTVTAKRVGKTGTRKLVKRVSARNGKFTIKLKLKSGRYKITAARAAGGGYLAGSSTRSARVK